YGARNIRVVGAVVAVRLRLRDRTDASHIRSAGYGMRAEDVIDGAKCVFGADKIGKRPVQEVHADGHINYGAGSAPGAQARRHAERSGVQLLVQIRHVYLDRFPKLILFARIQIGQCSDGRPTTDTYLLRRDHLREQLFEARFVGLLAIGGNRQFESGGPIQWAKAAAAEAGWRS